MQYLQIASNFLFCFLYSFKVKCLPKEANECRLNLSSSITCHWMTDYWTAETAGKRTHTSPSQWAHICAYSSRCQSLAPVSRANLKLSAGLGSSWRLRGQSVSSQFQFVFWSPAFLASGPFLLHQRQQWHMLFWSPPLHLGEHWADLSSPGWSCSSSNLKSAE